MADISTITVGTTTYNIKDAAAQRTLPTTTTANLFLKSTATAGTVVWGTDNNSDTKVTNTLGTTTKFYITGCTTATTNTGTQYFDTGVYVSATAGELVATKFTGALTGNVTGNCSGSSGSCTGNAATATKATQDESGNNIKASYAASMSISDHTITLKNKNGASLGTVTIPDNNTTYSFSNKAATLAWNATTTIATVGGTDITVKLPANPDTNTHTVCSGTSADANALIWIDTNA